MSRTSFEEFLQFIYDRLEHVHGESPNVDYMIRLRQAIEGLAAFKRAEGIV